MVYELDVTAKKQIAVILRGVKYEYCFVYEPADTSEPALKALKKSMEEYLQGSPLNEAALPPNFMARFAHVPFADYSRIKLQ